MTSSLDTLAATGLQTEFYQLVQTALYHADGMWGDATVDLYLRNLPTSHGYMVAAGIEDAVRAVQDLRFSDEDVTWLREQPMYAKLGNTFFESLRHFKFQGDIWAVPEGTPVFPLAPIMRITAPLPQVGLFEMLTHRQSAVHLLWPRMLRECMQLQAAGRSWTLGLEGYQVVDSQRRPPEPPTSADVQARRTPWRPAPTIYRSSASSPIPLYQLLPTSITAKDKPTRTTPYTTPQRIYLTLNPSQNIVHHYEWLKHLTTTKQNRMVLKNVQYQDVAEAYPELPASTTPVVKTGERYWWIPL